MFRKIIARLEESDRWYVAFIWLAACGLGADWAELHFMVGAFLAGVVMNSHWFNQEKMDFMRNHILLAIMPVFFLSTALKTNWGIGGAMVFVAAAGLLVGHLATKCA